VPPPHFRSCPARTEAATRKKWPITTKAFSPHPPCNRTLIRIFPSQKLLTAPRTNLLSTVTEVTDNDLIVRGDCEMKGKLGQGRSGLVLSLQPSPPD
jgi:hypothetical protein